MPPAPALHVEEAITSAEQREKAVRDASALLDEGLMYFIDNFVLSEDPSQCPKEYGRQLSAQHGTYLQQVREEIRLQSHNLRMFHARPRPCLKNLSDEDHLGLGNLDDLDALAKVATLVTAAVGHYQRMRFLHTKFVDVQSRLGRINALPPPDRIFIEQTLPGIVSVMEASGRDVAKLQSRLEAFKPAFNLLANQTVVATCITRLLESQITAEGFSGPATEPFKKLFRLARKREGIVKKASDLAMSQAIAWFSRPNGRVPSYVYHKELEKYEPFLHSIEGQKQVHDSCVSDLMALHQKANGWPLVVVGPNGQQISLSAIRFVIQEYECITETSYQLIEATRPINDTLREYTTELQQLIS